MRIAYQSAAVSARYAVRMPASALPVVVTGLVSAEEQHGSLPMPPIAYGIIAFVAFLIGLAVLWTFRNTAAKVPQRGPSNDAEHHG